MAHCKKCGRPISYRQGDFCNVCRYENIKSAPSIQKKIKPKELRTCKHCGRQFFTSKSGQIYCSHECNMAAYRSRNKAERPPRLCKMCGAPVPEGRRKYCSKACMDRSVGRTGKLTAEPRKCIVCGKVFTPQDKLRRYTCSPECSHQNALRRTRESKERQRAAAANKAMETATQQEEPLKPVIMRPQSPPRSTYLRPGGWTGEIPRAPQGPAKARLKISPRDMPYRGKPSRSSAKLPEDRELEWLYKQEERRRGYD